SWIYNWTPSNLCDGQYTTIIQVYERDWAEGRKEFGFTDLGHSNTLNDVVWGNARYQTDYIYAKPWENDGRSTTAIDDARKDVIWYNNGLWKGDYAGEIFMKIE